MPTRYFFDSEFMEDGHTIELLSIGMVCEDGREFYAVNRDAKIHNANSWVRENVFPHLPIRNGRMHESDIVSVVTTDLISVMLREFVDYAPNRAEFWAYYASYDWVVLCQLFGKMVDLPKGWPQYCMDIKQLAVSLGDPKLPKQTSIEHNALNDARWTRDSYLWLKSRVIETVSVGGHEYQRRIPPYEPDPEHRA